jgi:hypothetical protein
MDFLKMFDGEDTFLYLLENPLAGGETIGIYQAGAGQQRLKDVVIDNALIHKAVYQHKKSGDLLPFPYGKFPDVNIAVFA